MSNFLGSAPRRRTFFVLGGLCFVVLILLRAVLPSETTGGWVAVASVTDNLTASVLGSLVLLGIALHLWPVGEVSHELRPGEIRDTLLEGITRTSHRYCFRGRTASFLSATVLPRLAAQSTSTRRSIEVKIQMLDPTSETACELYADYRRRIKSGSESGREMQLKLLGHILSIHAYRSADALMKIEISISAAFSLFRLDLSDVHAVLTREAKDEPGLKLSAGTSAFNLFVEDFNLTASQARLLPDQPRIAAADLTTASAKAALASWGLDVQLTEQELTRVVKIAKAPSDPYA